MIESLRPYILLVRARTNRFNMVPIWLSGNVVFALVASSFLSGRNLTSLGRDFVLSVLSMTTIVLSVYIYNDITDIEIDRINKLDRPLVTGDASKREARNLVSLFAAVGLTSAFLVNLQVFLLILAYFVLLFSYSLPYVRLKNKFLLNKVAISFGTAISYLVGAATTGTIPAPVLLLAVFGFMSSLAMSSVNDLRDIEGDRIYKVKTLPVVWGPTLTIRFTIALVLSAGIATVMGYLQLGFNMAFPILASCAFAGWIYVIYPLLRHWNDPSYVRNTLAKKIVPIGFLLQALTVLGAII